ncbi:MAG: plastocyanin/azurin family-domain-containing protein [Monoraphidium minutum]|nr:MAG: plastocyanin/azurin family-domain-containing protein [Monoraphidium minutum]
MAAPPPPRAAPPACAQSFEGASFRCEVFAANAMNRNRRGTMSGAKGLRAAVQRVAMTAGVSVASLALTLSAHADATVKLGADSGALVFEPATVTVGAGETVTWVNNAGYPHNIVFDEDAVPEGVNADAISRDDYLNAPGETYALKFSTPGTYGYYCEPHQGAGMVGKVVVK